MEQSQSWVHCLKLEVNCGLEGKRLDKMIDVLQVLTDMISYYVGIGEVKARSDVINVGEVVKKIKSNRFDEKEEEKIKTQVDIMVSVLGNLVNRVEKYPFLMARTMYGNVKVYLLHLQELQYEMSQISQEVWFDRVRATLGMKNVNATGMSRVIVIDAVYGPTQYMRDLKLKRIPYSYLSVSQFPEPGKRYLISGNVSVIRLPKHVMVFERVDGGVPDFKYRYDEKAGAVYDVRKMTYNEYFEYHFRQYYREDIQKQFLSKEGVYYSAHSRLAVDYLTNYRYLYDLVSSIAFRMEQGLIFYFPGDGPGLGQLAVLAYNALHGTAFKTAGYDPIDYTRFQPEGFSIPWVEYPELESDVPRIVIISHCFDFLPVRWKAEFVDEGCIVVDRATTCFFGMIKIAPLVQVSLSLLDLISKIALPYSLIANERQIVSYLPVMCPALVQDNVRPLEYIIPYELAKTIVIDPGQTGLIDNMTFEFPQSNDKIMYVRKYDKYMSIPNDMFMNINFEEPRTLTVVFSGVFYYWSYMELPMPNVSQKMGIINAGKHIPVTVMFAGEIYGYAITGHYECTMGKVKVKFVRSIVGRRYYPNSPFYLK
jgi:hypothetical protein